MTIRMSLPENVSVPELLRNLGFSVRRLAAYPTAAALHSGAVTARNNLRDAAGSSSVEKCQVAEAANTKHHANCSKPSLAWS